MADTLADRFGRPAAPAITVVARTDAGDPADAGPPASRPTPRCDGSARSRQLATAWRRWSSTSSATRRRPAAGTLVQRMRADRPPGGQSWVTGDAAVLTDLLGLIRSALPAAVAVTLVAMVVLLFAMTGSLVVPIKAILANLVSLGATFGLLTAVFGHGFASGLLDTLTVGALNPFVAVVVFAFAFGLSMDYEVFLLARIKEYVDAGVPTDVAVRRGLQHTGPGHHLGGAAHGDRLRLLRRRPDGQHRADRPGPRRGRAHRRDDRALPAGAGHDDAARPVELVGAGLAAAGARPHRPARAILPSMQGHPANARDTVGAPS